MLGRSKSSSPEDGGVPWAKVVNTGPSNSSAPGPPTSTFLNRSSPSQSRKASMASPGDQRSQTPMVQSPLDELTEAARKGDLEGWDPMSFDFKNKSFNSYVEGPGKLIQSREEKDIITLFVDRIPAAINKEGLRNLFSAVGSVRRVTIIPVQSNRNTTYGFVEYSTVRDAEAAIQEYNNKDMGNNIRLVVKVSESKKHREDRKRELMEERQFSKSLHCAKNDTSFNQLESDEEAEKALSNPLQPKYISPGDSESLSSKYSPNNSRGTSASSSAQAFNKSKVKSKCEDVSSEKICKVCQKPAVSRCSRCKTAYCTKECQREDWPRHRNECTSSEVRKSSKSVHNDRSPGFADNSEVLIAEGPDDEGFEIYCPSPDELVDLKQVLQERKTSEGLADLMAHINISEDSPEHKSRVPSFRKQSRQDSSEDKCEELPDRTIIQSLIPSSPMSLDRSLSRESNVSVSLQEGFVSLQSIYSQLQLFEKPLPSLPPLSSPPLQFQAVVTFISSPCEFNVLIPSVEVKQALQFIRTTGHALKLGSITANQLTVGSKCGYKNEKEEFVRVSVCKIKSPTEVVVSPCDFGGRYSVPARDLIHLSEELVLIPNLTRHCILKDFSVTEHGKANLPDAITAFKALVETQAVCIENLGVKAGSVVCTALSSESNSNLLDSLLQSKYVTKTSLSEDDVSRLPLRLSYSSSKVEYHHVEQGSMVVILPTVVSNPGLIWATIDHPHLDNVAAMHKDMNLCYPPKDSSFNPYVPAKGEICVAKYSQDQKYYRAEVILVHHNGMADVRFVETGHTESLSVSQLYHINPDFLTLPKQARRFSLSGVAPHQSSSWSDNAIAFVKSKVLNRHVNVKVLTVDTDRVLIEMFDPDLPNQLLNNSLILLGHAEVGQPKKLLKADASPRLKGVSAFLTEVLPSKDADNGTREKKAATSSPVVAEESPGSPQTPATQPSSCSSSNGEVMIAPDMFFLSEGDFVKVCLSHSVSLERFYVQLVEPSHLSKVESVLGKIQSTKLVSLPKKHIKKGTVCLCRYSGDNEVHRAQIIGVFDQKITVVFKDYGNVFHCSEDVLYKITEELLDLPFQSIACSLNQVKNPAGSKKDWDPAALTHFSKLLESGPLKAKVVKVVGVLHVVDLKLNSPQGVVDVLATMIEAGFVLPRSREMGLQKKNPQIQKKQSEASEAHDVSVCPEKPKFSKSPFKKEPDNSVESSMLAPGSCKASPSTKISDSRCDEGIDKVFPPFSKLEKITFSSDEKSQRVLITEVVALNEIYVQVVSSDSMSAMSSVSQSLESLSQENPKNSSKVVPPADSLCAAKYSQDSLWYRCKVESWSDTKNTVNVQFIDYGNRDEVFLSEVVPCPTDCVTVPAVAIRCALAITSSMQVDQNRALKFFKKHVNNSEALIKAEMLSFQDSIHLVKITIGDADVIQEMKVLGIVVDIRNNYPMITTMKSMTLPTDLQKVKVIISEVVSPTEVYVQVASDEVKESLITIGKGLNAVLTSDQSSCLDQCPDVGSLCCARFSVDNHWYRAVVTKNLGSTIEVQFVDYGNTETVVLGDIVACPKEFTSYPLVAIKCELDGLQSLKALEAEKVTQYLKQHTTDVFYSPEIISNQNGVPSLTLRNEKGISLVDELLPLNLIERSSCWVKDLPRVQLPDGEFKMLMGEVHTPSNFFVQVATVENAHILEEINEGLNNNSVQRKSLSSFPEVGALCCAKFSVDKQWYRAEVIANKQDYCEVLFLDYGNFDKATLSDLAVCPSQLCSLPVQAIKCGLNITPLQVESENGLVQYLQKELGGVLLDGKVANHVDGIPQLIIFNEGRSVVEELVSLKVLSPSKISPNLELSSSVDHILVKDMESVDLPNTGSFKALVTEVVSAAEIYVQVAIPEVGHIEKDVSDALSTSKKCIVSSSPVVGSLYCAKFSVDEQWYRAEVKAVDQTNIQVFFIDYGTMDTVSQDCVALCPEKVSRLPRIASRISLDGLSAPLVASEKITMHLKNSLLNNLVFVSVSHMKGNDVLVNIMKDGNEILNELSSLGLLKTECYHYVKDMTSMKLPEAKHFKVLISSLVSHKKFYVQVATQKCGELLSSISDIINKACKSFEFLKSAPEVGILCCAKFSDGEWYRAEVLEVINEKVNVKSLEYGNVESVNASELAVCPEKLSELPCVAIECSLGNLHGLKVSSNDLDVLLNKYTDIILSAEIVGMVDNVTELMLAANGVNILEELSPAETSVQNLQHVPKKLEYVTLPSSGEFQVLITEVVSPIEFYVQLATAKVGDFLKKVTDVINNKELKPCQSYPAPGSLCCAQFSQDMQWYRAKVVSIDKSSCNVQFVDFGNTDTVSLSDLSECPSECCDVPLLACPCRLEGFPINKDVSVEIVNAFKERSSTESLLTAKTISYSSNVYELALVNNGENISDIIFDKTSQSSYSWPLVSTMKTIEIPTTSQSIPVSVTEILNLQDIYVQFATQQVAVMLNDISDGLQKHFDTKYRDLNNPPPLGSLCCAKYSKDALWYRAELKAIEKDNYVVHFLDYGNADTLPLASLAECPPQFFDFPILAVRCTIVDIPLKLISSPDATLYYLREVSLDVETMLKIQDIVHGVPQVKLFWEGKDIIYVLKEAGLLNSCGYIKADLPGLSFPPSGNVKCLVYGVISLSEFYVHVNNTERSSILSKIEKLVNDMLAKNALKPSFVPPSVGDLCLAKFSEDEMWYRGRVERINEDICEIVYLDYRNVEKVEISKLVPCPENIASLPQVAIRCGLYGIPSSLAPSSELLSNFKDIVSNNAVFEGKFICNIGGIPQIELVEDNSNILNLLGITSNFPMYSSMRKLQLPTSGETFQVLVCELLNPSELYVQVNSEESISAIQKLSEKQCTLTDLTPLTSFPPIGSVCIAKFSQDGMWYRARVDSVTDDSCNVFFFDYGNYEIVTLSEMVACPADWLEIPVVSVTCSLHGLDNMSQDWSSSSRSILKTLTSERLLNASVVNNQLGSNTSVQLSDITNGKLISVEFRNMIQPSGSTVAALRKCQVTEVNHPGSLYFQYLEADNANNLSLLNKLQEFYSNPAHYAGFVPAVDSLCCAQFTEDKLWYRCKVLNISGDKVKLSYIDFGTIDFVSTKEIYQLDDSFASQPPFAIHAKIRGIKPTEGGVWTKGAINKLTELCDKVLFASVVHQDTDVVNVDLFEDELRQASIADILVSSGHASFKN